MDMEKVIKATELLDDFFNEYRAVYYISPHEAWEIIKDALKEQEAVVRCKDCKHATITADGKMCKYCAMDTDDFGDRRDVYHDADWFCADGERQEGE